MHQSSRSKFEVLEGRQLLSAAWGAQAKLIGQDLVAAQFPQITGAGESVVVIDSGVDYNHPSLGGGWGNKVVAGWDFASNDSDPMSSSYAHGTGVAGMLAASPFDYGGQHFQGIAPGVKIIALRETNTSQVASALQWVIANKAKYNIVAINYTDFGGGNKTIAQSMRASLATLAAMKVYVSTPSGNNGSTGGIADVGGEANVGSVNKGGGMSGFTNRGSGLDYLAPGEKVTLPYYDVGSKRGIYVDVADGTSFSAPQIAGAAALIRQVNPNFSNADINSILSTSAVQTYDSATKRSYSRLNLYGAITLAYQRIGKATPAAPPPSDPGAPAGVSISTPTPIGTNSVLELENFDSGNDGTTYHDAESANLGGNSYRNGTGVDIISARDQGSTRAVGVVKAGEWLRYTTNVQSAGTYSLEFRVAALGAGGKFHLEVDGKNVTGSLAVPDTKSWTSYASVTKTGVALTAGQHTMRLVFETNGKTGYVGNFNLVRFVKSGTAASAPAGTTASTPTPIGTSTVIEAENFDSGNEGAAYHDADSANLGGNNYRPGTGVDIVTMSDQNSTRAVGVVKAGEWLKYTTSVQTAGTYNIEFRVSALGAGGKFRVEVDGINVTGSLAVPDTKNWNTYTSVTKSGVKLTAGQHVMRLVFETNGKTGYVGNFNLMRFTQVAATSSPAAVTAPPSPANKAVNLSAGTYVAIQAEDFDNGANGVAYKDSTSANQGGLYRNTSVDLEKSADSTGGYDVGYMTQGEWLNYTVNVAKGGTFNVDARIASAYTGGKFHLEVDGKNVTGSLGFVNTGNFQTWTTLRKTGVAISAGQHTIRLVIETTGGHPFAGNVNWIQFS